MKTGAMRDATGELRVPCTRLAANPWTRLRGLLFRPPLSAGEGLLLRPCSSVHTLWMRYAIDLVFLARDGRVQRVVEALPPRRFAVQRNAHATLELPAGDAARLGIAAGMVLAWERD